MTFIDRPLVGENKISDATVRRLSLYYRSLKYAYDRGMRTISSQELADMNNLTAAQVRKDLSFFGAFGRRGLGYYVADLQRNIARIIGINKTWNVALVGAGNIGRALLDYDQFRQQGFLIKVLFDNDPTKIGKTFQGLEVKDFGNVAEEIKQNKIKIAIIAVPAQFAQSVVDRLIGCKVRAVLNFAPITLQVPENIWVRNENMAIEIEALSFALTNRRDPTRTI
ncbi:MAG: redox-sensing transcriptional repressor Rex [Candidatus Electryonea clarkiae]|nr:redox-sensing transcriptional repressor Rex [Candidatus Electryonea clarkiae]MDP8288980.1 redox-sensing transcriptional repressor Rex [Candidatus Electryonea clarkiae]